MPKKKKRAAAKKKVRTCGCGRPWERGMCPDCRNEMLAYREAVDYAKRNNKALYNEWIYCHCGAFNKKLERTKDHDRSCPSARSRRTS